ncbi:hypothetical protein [Paracoccus aestuariivivens]|uniref:AlgX/AlgJ SGNH hydrolase-like domain-containing protein n=1 Tax=Paracoccus aestuariivivens TaxID=1820333 RepID=A0A6L6JFD8_9RHOB|nr:hypothetical protein [Paracoccus aestuariivivens]MTH80286.1 hypothetical protein [Paracoccus aestuariivivens]
MSILPSEVALSEGEISAEVIGGKDGWLFLHGGAAAQFDYLTGKKKVHDQHVQNMERNTLRRHAKAQTVGARYLNVVMPSKPICCAEKLPDSYAGKCRSLFETYFNTGMNSESRRMTLYPIDVMRGSENFKRLDTHPNDLGNLRAARVILQNLDITLRDAPALVDHPTAGDLAVMLNRREMRSQEPTILRPLHGLRDFDNIYFLKPGTNTGHMRVLFNPKDTEGRTLLVCGDSFIVGLLPLLAREFETVLYVRGPVFPYEVIESFRPSHIISASTERYISGQIDDINERSVLERCKSADWYHFPFGPSQAIRALMARAKDQKKYTAWKHHACLRPLSHPLLGTAYTNSMITNGENGWEYRSTGVDPFFTFCRTAIPADRCVNIKFSIKVDQDCLAQIFYSESGNVMEKYSPNNSRSFYLKCGYNEVSALIPKGPKGRNVRLDPVNQAASFSIHGLDVDCE